MAKKTIDPAKDIQALMQAAINVSGKVDSDEHGDCASCHRPIDSFPYPPKDEDNCNCQNPKCRAFVMRSLMTKLAKKYGFKVPTMDVKKYDLGPV